MQTVPSICFQISKNPSAGTASAATSGTWARTRSPARTVSVPRRWPRLTGLLDGIYCLTVGTVSFLFLLRRADGELRGFLVLGALGGAVLFFCVFSHR